MCASRRTHAANSFRLLTLGGLSLVAPSGSVVRQQRRRLALLALVAAGGERGVPRDKLLFWLSPEGTTESARHSLHQLLYYLRQQAGEAAFIGTDPLILNPEVFSSDLSDFEHAVEIRLLADAAGLYKGPFLDGFHLHDSPEFDQWAMAERSRLASVFCDLLGGLATDATSRNDHIDAIKWNRRLADQDPLSGRAALRLMRSLEAAGDGAAALRHARSYETLVRAELGSGPDAEVSAFVERHRAADRTVPTVGKADPLPTSENDVTVRGGEPVRAVIPAAGAAAHRHRWSRTAKQGILAAVLVTAASGYFIRSQATSNELTPDDEILVGDFVSHPDDSLSARALSAVLRSSLHDSRSVSIVSRAELDRALERMQLPINSSLDFRLGQDLAARNGYEAYLGGGITRMGTGYVVSAQLMTVGGKELATLSETSSSPDALIPAVGRLSIRLRKSIGESARILGAVPPLSEVTTRSLHALRLFTQAYEEDRAGRGQTPGTISLLRQAIAADSTFAMAHRLLGIKLYNMQATREAIRELRHAERLSDHLSEVERLQALSSLHLVLRDFPRAVAEAEQVLKLRPNGLWAFNQIGLLDNWLGRYEHGREIAKRRLQLDSTGFSLGPSTALYQGLGAEAVDMARAEFIRNQNLKGTDLSDRGRQSMALVHGAIAAFDSAEHYSAPAGRADGGDPQLLAHSQLARGQAGKAFLTLGVRRRGADGGPPGDRFSPLAETVAATATAVMFGDLASSSRRLDAVVRDSMFRHGDPADRSIDLIVALVLAGRVRDARAELTEIERASDADLQTARDPEFSIARGAVALGEKRFPEAIESFRRASSPVVSSPHTMLPLYASPGICRVCVLPLLGRAYEAADQPDSAIAIYERFLSTGDPERTFPDGIWRATVLHRLGDLHARRGDTLRAAERFEQFVLLWGNADVELQPKVQSTRRRLVELRRAAGLKRTASSLTK